MIGFLKSFLSNDKTAEEKALISRMTSERERDVLRIDGYDEQETPAGQGCGPQRGGCGNCGCGA